MVADEFIRRRTTEVSLRDGTRIRLRPIRADDKALLTEGMRHLSAESRYRRFFSPVEKLSPAFLQHLTEIDYVNHFAWLALAPDEVGVPAIAVGRYIRTTDRPHCAEVAITVRDDYQGRGVGTLLLEILGMVAIQHGITEFSAIVLPENQAMRQLLLAEGVELHFDRQQGAMRGSGSILAPVHAVKNAALFAALNTAARGEVGVDPAS